MELPLTLAMCNLMSNGEKWAEWNKFIYFYLAKVIMILKNTVHDATMQAVPSEGMSK
jgi:hypothetical protein